METNQTTRTRNTRRAALCPPPFLPFDYQKKPISAMIDTILRGENGLVVQPTATGKSVEAAFTARACILLHGMKGLYLYDENEGLQQARLKFEQVFGENNISCANFFGYGKDGNVHTADIVFASFQSMNNHHEKWYTTLDPNHFDFIIVNEAHGGQAVTYKEVVDYYTCSKIGMTATPRRMDGKDILEIFEKVIFFMSLEEAIINNWVAKIDYHIKSHGISTQKLNQICKEVLEEGKRVSLTQLNESIFIEALDEEILKEIYRVAFFETGTPLQTLIFCENIPHASHMFELLKKDGKRVGVVHSKMGKNHNRDTVQAFRHNELQFLISINKLNEDIDVPNVQLEVFLRATDSETVFFQQLGRGLRKIRGKEKLIVLDFVANCERLLMVKGLEDRIVALVEEGQILVSQLDKRPLFVSGEGFDFKYTTEIIDALKLIIALRGGFYTTWQEASKAAIKLGFFAVKPYRKNYYRADSKLPARPEHFYRNFPGWDTFFGRPLAPEGWKRAEELGREKSLVGRKTIKKFVNQFRLEHPEWFGTFRAGDLGAKHYHPDLVKLIEEEINNKQRPPKDWVAMFSLCKQIHLGKVRARAELNNFRSEYPHWFKSYFGISGKTTEYYHPKLVEKIKERLSHD